MKLYYIEYYDGYDFVTEHIWAHNLTQLEETILSRCSTNRIELVQYITNKSKITDAED